MHPDNTAPLILAARKRRELARAKAVRALREIDRAGTPVTFEAVARAAGVSRSWLYGQPDLRAEIHRLREATSRAATPPIRASQRASDTSLLRHLRHHRPRRRTRSPHPRGRTVRRRPARTLLRKAQPPGHRLPRGPGRHSAARHRARLPGGGRARHRVRAVRAHPNAPLS